jgi:hypothetical protein
LSWVTKLFCEWPGNDCFLLGLWIPKWYVEAFCCICDWDKIVEVMGREWTSIMYYSSHVFGGPLFRKWTWHWITWYTQFSSLRVECFLRIIFSLEKGKPINRNYVHFHFILCPKLMGQCIFNFVWLYKNLTRR